MINPTLSLFQLCDSNFPVGSFSQSFGLETYLQNDTVRDSDTFTEWLTVYVQEQLAYADGIAARLVYGALDHGDLEQVWELDRLLMVQILARESRDGTQRMGESMLNISESIYNIPLLSTYRDRIRKKEAFGHPAIVFTMVSHHLQVD